MTHCIYVIENLLDGKKYVGYTHDREGRWREHQRVSKRSQCHLHRAMRKHGVGNFRFYVVEECSSMEEGYRRETAWIQKLSTFGSGGYNMSLGGDGPRGRTVTAETRRKMSDIKKGQMPWNKGNRIGSQGFRHSDESRTLMSDKKRGTIFSEEHRQKLREAWKRRKEMGLPTGGGWNRKEQHVEETITEAIQRS